MLSRRIVNVSVLQGQPRDGSGRVCIHLFVQDPKGPFIEPHVLHPVIGADGQEVKQQCTARPTRGRLACDLRRKVAPVKRGQVTTVTLRTEDPRVVTCPKCLASEYYAKAIERHGG